MQLLDKVVPAEDDGEWSHGDILARDLSRFGNAAKQELLKQAVGSQPGWRNVAGAILANWKSWDTADVPALRQALRLSPSGWIARPLGKIATPEAVATLAEDLAHSDDEGQTDFVLINLGPRVISSLMPLFEDDRATEAAGRVLHGMTLLHPEAKESFTGLALQWVAQALDPARNLRLRLAALRALAALGPLAQTEAVGLHPLLDAPEVELKEQASITLQAVHDPLAAVALAHRCQPHADPLDGLALDSSLCLRDIAGMDTAGRDAGELLLPFLSSKNGVERALGILTLGRIGYEPATPSIETALTDANWIVVNSAVWSLGWLNDKNAIPQLERVARTHWLPEVRAHAAKVIKALCSSQTQSLQREWDDPNQSLENPFMNPSDGLGWGVPSCKGGRWKWKDEAFNTPTEETAQASSLQFRNNGMFGELVGTDHGEWGGQLAWLPVEGKPEILFRENVTGMEYDSGAALVFVSGGSFNFGSILALKRSADGSWNLTEVARLPGRPEGWERLKSGAFAVASGGHMVVVSSQNGVLGLATCTVGH